VWQEVGLVGRDKLLKDEIYPRAQGKKAPFLLSGSRGIGKSALLQWAYEHAKAPAAYISASFTVKECLIAICRDWGLVIVRDGKAVKPERVTMAVLEEAINKAHEGRIFADDIHNASPAFLRRLKLWRERFAVSMAGVPPFKREELKRNLWGLHEIEVSPLSPEARKELAWRVCQHVGSDKLPSEVAIHSRGYPGRIVAQALGVVEMISPRVEGEELDLSPFLLLVMAGMVAVRYVGIGLGEIDLYILGGLAMGLMVFFRFFLFKGMRE